MESIIVPAADREFATLIISNIALSGVERISIKFGQMELAQATALLRAQQSLCHEFSPSFAIDPMMTEVVSAAGYGSPIAGQPANALNVTVNLDGVLHLDVVLNDPYHPHITYDIPIHGLRRALTWTPELYAAEREAITQRHGTKALTIATTYGECADIPALQQAIIESGDARAIADFARLVKGADIPALQHAILSIENIESDDVDVRSLAAFALLPGTDVQLLQQAVIQSGSADGALEFAEKLIDAGADIPALQAVVTASKNPDMIYAFAKLIHGADIKACQQAVIESGSAFYITRFALDIKGVDILALQAGLTARAKAGKCDAEDLFAFARDVKGADIPPLWRAICDTGHQSIIDMAYNRFEKELYEAGLRPERKQVTAHRPH